MSLIPFLRQWRTTPLQDREVIDALVDRDHEAPSSELSAALAHWPGSYYWSDEADGRHLVLTRPTYQPREAWGVHLFLAIAVLITMTISGSVFTGALPIEMRLWAPAALLRALPSGLTFSLPLFAILLSHELGHYLTARHYRLSVSPPFFIPGIPAPYGIGTFGAFIRLRTIVNDRRQLLDVGAAGPIAGFVVALPVLLFGILRSQPTMGVTGMVAGPLLLGDSPITLLLRHFTVGSATAIELHPFAVAGWFGMFVTMLNLLPMAQLDGGHILYALFPSWHRRVALLFWIGTIVLSRISWTWFFWAVVVLLLSRGRLDHPPVLDVYRPLPRNRVWLLVISVILFVLTFTPVPLRS